MTHAETEVYFRSMARKLELAAIDLDGGSDRRSETASRLKTYADAIRSEHTGLQDIPRIESCWMND